MAVSIGCGVAAWIHKVRAWEGLICRLTFRPRMKPDETRVNHEKMTSRFMRVCWKKMGLPLLSEKIASKFWTTMTWAVHDGDVPILLGLRSILGWRTTVWWRSRSSWCKAWDPYNVQRWKPKVCLLNRGVQWDTPMARGGKEKGVQRVLADKATRGSASCELGIPVAGKLPTL